MRSRWGRTAYWMTTAPPGITINQALTANGDVNAGGWTTGVVVGDFWQNVTTGAWGGSTLAQGQHWFNTGLEGSPNINSQIYGIQIVCTQTECPVGGYCSDSTPPWFTVSGITLEGTENTAHASRDKAPCGRQARTCGIHRGMTSPSRCTPATCPASAPQRPRWAQRHAERPFGAAG